MRMALQRLSQSQVPPAKPEARFEPPKAVGGVTPVLNADLRGQKLMRRFRSPQGPALRAGQFSAAALRQTPDFSYPSSPCLTALATVPPQKTPSEAPHRLLLADPRRTNRRLSALLSAYLSVSKYGVVNLFESSGKAGGLPMELVARISRQCIGITARPIRSREHSSALVQEPSRVRAAKPGSQRMAVPVFFRHQGASGGDCVEFLF